jgi:hypothetical protein
MIFVVHLHKINHLKTVVDLLFLDNLAVVLVFYTLQDKHKIHIYIVRNYKNNLQSLPNARFLK